MTQKKDLVFLPVPQQLRERLVRENGGVLVNLPFRFMRGVGDEPVPTVGFSGINVYGRDDLPEGFAYDVAKSLDEKRELIRWTNQPFSYDPTTVPDGRAYRCIPAPSNIIARAGIPCMAQRRQSKFQRNSCSTILDELSV